MYRKLRAPMLIVVLLSIFLFSVTTSFAATPIPDKPVYSGYKWKTTSPVVQYLSMSNDYRSESLSAISDVSAALQVASGSSLNLVRGTSTSSSASNMQLGEIVMVANNYGTTGWVGQTTTWVYSNDSTRIYYALVKLNQYYWGSGQCMVSPNYPYHGAGGKQAVAAHELCHAIGVGHVTLIPSWSDIPRNFYSIMYPSVNNYSYCNVRTVDGSTKSLLDSKY